MRGVPWRLTSDVEEYAKRTWETPAQATDVTQLVRERMDDRRIG